MAVAFEYDPSRTISYGQWHCPSCDTRFAGNGAAAHKDNCPDRDKDYENCVYVFGPKEVQHAKAKAETGGEDAETAGPLTLRILKDKFPQLV